MAKNKRWTIPFMSLNGTSCRIDIYQDGYEGSTVTEISPNNANTPGYAAPDPIVLEEDDDEDLLTVTRYATGYINLIEKEYGAMDAMFPKTNTEMLVEYYYGQILKFKGFIQAQDFDGKWSAGPREVSLPVISPIGILEDINIPVVNPPKYVTLAQELADIIDVLNGYGANIQTVTWPKEVSSRLNGIIRSLAVCPFNSDHTTAKTDSPLFAPKTAKWMVDAICNAYGWMVHEMPGIWIFTRIDHTGGYYTINASDLRTFSNVVEQQYTGADIVNMDLYVEPADANGEVSHIMPVEEVELNYDNEYILSSEFNFKHLTWNGYTSHVNTKIAWLKSQTPELTGAYLLESNGVDASGKLTEMGATACVYGINRNDLKEAILVNLPNDSVVYNLEIFRLKFYDLPNQQSVGFKYDRVWGDAIHQLGTDGSVLHKNLNAFIKSGDLYYHGNASWSQEKPAGGFPLDGTTLNIQNIPSYPLEFIIQESGRQVGDYVDIIGLVDPRLESSADIFADYNVDEVQKDIIRNNNVGKGTASIELGLTKYRYGSNQIDSSLPYNYITEYPYLFTTQERLQIRCKIKANMPPSLYQTMAQFNGNNYRMVALTHEPWNDEVVVTLQRNIS